MIALPLSYLRELQPSACSDDGRVVLNEMTGQLSFRKELHSGIVLTCELPTLSSTRELRLLAKQLEVFADYLDHAGPSFEVLE